MKTIKILVFTAIIVLTFVSSEGVAAAKTDKTSPIENSADAAKAAALLARIDEINAMDKTNISASEKRALRKEVRQSKKKLNEIGGGVYISVGALIIILLLLIILL